MYSTAGASTNSYHLACLNIVYRLYACLQFEVLQISFMVPMNCVVEKCVRCAK